MSWVESVLRQFVPYGPFVTLSTLLLPEKISLQAEEASATGAPYLMNGAPKVKEGAASPRLNAPFIHFVHSLQPAEEASATGAPYLMNGAPKVKEGAASPRLNAPFIHFVHSLRSVWNGRAILNGLCRSFPLRPTVPCHPA